MLAAKVLRRVLEKSPEGFNGVHLRVEGDAKHAGYFEEISGTDSARVSFACQSEACNLKILFCTHTSSLNIVSSCNDGSAAAVASRAY